MAYADELFRRGVRNKEPGRRIAKSLGLDDEQVQAALSLLRKCRRVPSPERLALVAMKDPGLTDEDIAEMFSRTKKWAAAVRDLASDLVANEPIDDSFYPWIFERDPSPEQILEMAKASRSEPGGSKPSKVAGVRQFWWTGVKFE